MIQVLKTIRDKMDELNINYEFMEWSGNIVYPYFVGEYVESPTDSEDGKNTSTFLLTGFTRGAWLELAQVKTTLQREFDDFRTITENGAGISIIYSDATAISTGDAELKRIQINLNIKEWSVK